MDIVMCCNMIRYDRLLEYVQAVVCCDALRYDMMDCWNTNRRWYVEADNYPPLRRPMVRNGDRNRNGDDKNVFILLRRSTTLQLFSFQPICRIHANIFSDTFQFIIIPNNAIMIIGLPTEFNIIYIGITFYC